MDDEYEKRTEERLETLEALETIYGGEAVLRRQVDSWYDGRYGLPPDDMVCVAFLSRTNRRGAVLQSDWCGTEEQAQKNLQRKIDVIAEFRKQMA